MVEERAFDQPLVVLGPRTLHDRESLDRAEPGRAQQYELANLLLIASRILDRDLPTQTACYQVIRRGLHEAIQVLREAIRQEVDVNRLPLGQSLLHDRAVINENSRRMHVIVLLPHVPVQIPALTLFR